MTASFGTGGLVLVLFIGCKLNLFNHCHHPDIPILLSNVAALCCCAQVLRKVRVWNQHHRLRLVCDLSSRLCKVRVLSSDIFSNLIVTVTEKIGYS